MVCASIPDKILLRLLPRNRIKFLSLEYDASFTAGVTRFGNLVYRISRCTISSSEKGALHFETNMTMFHNRPDGSAPPRELFSSSPDPNSGQEARAPHQLEGRLLWQLAGSNAPQRED